MVLFAASRFSSDRETIATRAPSTRKALAQARPMPLLPPAMRTFFCLRPRSICAPGIRGQGRNYRPRLQHNDHPDPEFRLMKTLLSLCILALHGVAIGQTASPMTPPPTFPQAAP